MAAKKQKWWVRWVPLAVMTLGGIGVRYWMIGYGGSGSGGDPQAAETTIVATVKRGDLEIEVVDTGRVLAHEKTDIKSRLGGQVQKVLVQPGDHVTRGQLLFQLDDVDNRRDLARAEAEVTAAKNALALAQSVYERRSHALEARAATAAEVELAQGEVNAKRVALRIAEVALAAAQDRVRYTSVLAPINGVITDREVEPGETISPGVQAIMSGHPLLTISDLSSLRVSAELNQIDAARVSVGQKVTVKVDALPGRTYQAEVTHVAPAATTARGRDVDVFPVEATLTDADGRVKPGMTAELRVHLDTRPGVLSLPIEAVAEENGKSYVTKLLSGDKADSKTTRVEVRVGARNDRDLEIVSGLAAGDRVLVKPDSAEENELKL